MAMETGVVMSVEHATNGSSFRSFVTIKWDGGETTDHCRGHEGSVDIECVTVANGEMYYRDHLPKIGTSVGRVISEQHSC